MDSGISIKLNWCCKYSFVGIHLLTGGWHFECREFIGWHNVTLHYDHTLTIPTVVYSYYTVVHSYFNYFIQCDQIGWFFKVLCNKFAYKSSPNRLLTFGLFCKKINSCNNCCGYYLGNFWKHLGNFFNPASGHTDCITLILHLANKKQLFPLRRHCYDHKWATLD